MEPTAHAQGAEFDKKVGRFLVLFGFVGGTESSPVTLCDVSPVTRAGPRAGLGRRILLELHN